MQNAIIALKGLGRMPDSTKDNPTEEIVDGYDRLLNEVKLPLTQEEVNTLIDLFPESSLYELEWSLLHLVETYLVENPLRDSEYRQLISTCPSDEWKETLQIRLNNWQKKRGNL